MSCAGVWSPPSPPPPTPGSFTTTLAPFAASRFATSAPTPRPEPVQIATRPSSIPILSFLRILHGVGWGECIPDDGRRVKRRVRGSAKSDHWHVHMEERDGNPRQYRCGRPGEGGNVLSQGLRPHTRAAPRRWSDRVARRLLPDLSPAETNRILSVPRRLLGTRIRAPLDTCPSRLRRRRCRRGAGQGVGCRRSPAGGNVHVRMGAHGATRRSLRPWILSR